MTIEQPSDNLLGIGHGYVQLGLRILLAKHAQGTPQPIHQRGYTRGEMERASVLLRSAMEVGFYAPHLVDHCTRMFCQAIRHRCRRKLAPGAHKELRLQMLRQALELQAHRSGREMHSLRASGYAAGIQNREKHLELMHIHRNFSRRAELMAPTL